MLTLLERRRALRYIGVTQSNQFYPEMRARVHAMFVKDKWWSHFQDNKSLPFALHFSLLPFMAGVLIYFFNVNHATFGAVAWWITYTSIEHTAFTVVPIFQRDALYYAPLFSFLFELYLDLLYRVSRVCFWIKPGSHLYGSIRIHRYNLRQQYSEGLVGNKAEWVKEAASEPSWVVDTKILDHILQVVDEDEELKTFFDAIPGFFNSELVQRPLGFQITTELRRAMDGFLDRTFSSHLVPESVKNDRLITCLNVAHSVLGPWETSEMLGNLFEGRRNKSVEIGHSLSRWGRSTDGPISADLRKIIACIIVCTQDRDDRWRKLVTEVFGVPDGVLRDDFVHDDSVLLAILIHVTRDDLRAGRWDPGVLNTLSQFDIHNTATELRHEFCALWNEIVQEATNDGYGSTRTQILAGIRHLFITLHRCTDATPNESPVPLVSDDDSDSVLRPPSSYPLCNIPDHYPNSAAQDLVITPPIPTPKFRIRHHSEPVIWQSVVQRSRTSLSLRRTQSCSHFPTVPLPTGPIYQPRSSPLVSPPPLTNPPGSVTKDAVPHFADITVISGIADQIHGSSSTAGPTVQQVEGTRKTPFSDVLGSLPTPLPTPAPSHSASSALLPPSMDPATTQTYLLHHAPGAPTSTTTPSFVSLQDTTVSDRQPDPGRTLEQDDIQDSRPPTPRMDYGQSPPGGATVL